MNGADGMARNRLSSAAVSTAVVGGGDLLVKILMLAVTILLMRAFTPAGYGIITAMMTLSSVLPIFLDFGTTPSVIRFGPLLEARELTGRRDQLFRSIFRMRLWLSTGVLIVLVPISPWIAGLLLHDPARYRLVIAALIGAVGTAFMQFLIGVHQSREHYLAMTGIKLTEALSKLILVAALVLILAGGSPAHAILIYAVSPFLAIAVSARQLKAYVRRHKVDYSILRNLFEFSFWYMSANVFLVIFMNFDVLIIAALRPPEDVGYFGAGYRIASILFLAVNAVFTVMVPRASRKTDQASLGRFIKKSVGACTLGAAAMTPFVLLGPRLIRLVAGDSYLPAVDVFALTAWDHVVMLLFTPLMVTIFTINRPRLLALFAALEMVLNIAGDLAVVPHYGPAGAAAVTLATRLFAGSICSLYLWRKFKTDPGFLREVF